VHSSIFEQFWGAMVRMPLLLMEGDKSSRETRTWHRVCDEVFKRANPVLAAQFIFGVNP
jgi:hypothetical protein